MPRLVQADTGAPGSRLPPASDVPPSVRATAALSSPFLSSRTYPSFAGRKPLSPPPLYRPGSSPVLLTSLLLKTGFPAMPPGR